MRPVATIQPGMSATLSRQISGACRLSRSPVCTPERTATFATPALVAISMALYGFWRMVQFLEKHGLPEEESHADQTTDDDKPD
jgi:hypothetical protein